MDEGVERRGEAAPIAGDRQGVCRAHVESNPAVRILEHIARHFCNERGQVEWDRRDAYLSAFKPAELAHLRNEGSDAGAGTFRFLQHLSLFV